MRDLDLLVCLRFIREGLKMVLASAPASVLVRKVSIGLLPILVLVKLFARFFARGKVWGHLLVVFSSNLHSSVDWAFSCISCISLQSQILHSDLSGLILAYLVVPESCPTERTSGLREPFPPLHSSGRKHLAVFAWVSLGSISISISWMRICTCVFANCDETIMN